MSHTAARTDISLDVAEVGREKIRHAVRTSIEDLFHSCAVAADFWGAFPDRIDTIPIRMLVIADLSKIVKRYQSSDYHDWIASVRRAQPYFLVLVRTKRDQHYADLVDDLMRHSDLRMSVCRTMSPSEFRNCLWDAVSALDPNAVADVRYAASTDRLWVTYSDGVSGLIDWESLLIADLLDELRLDSATVGRGGANVEMLTKGGDVFEIDALSIKALLDAGVARSIAERAGESDAEVGARIRSARLAAGLSQTELGEKVGIDQAIVSKLERGKHQPRIDTLRRIAEGLDLSVAELLTREDPDGV